jgi:hypothetical protein
MLGVHTYTGDGVTLAKVSIVLLADALLEHKHNDRVTEGRVTGQWWSPVFSVRVGCSSST